MLFQIFVVWVFYYSEVLSKYAKKKICGFRKKWSFKFTIITITDSAFNYLLPFFFFFEITEIALPHWNLNNRARFLTSAYNISKHSSRTVKAMFYLMQRLWIQTLHPKTLVCLISLNKVLYFHFSIWLRCRWEFVLISEWVANVLSLLFYCFMVDNFSSLTNKPSIHLSSSPPQAACKRSRTI